MSLAISFVNQFLSKRETRPRYCTSQNTSGLNVKLWGPLGVVISLNLIDGVGVTCYIFTGSQFPVWRSGPPLPAAECVPRKVRGSRKAHNPFRQLSTLSDFIAFSLPSAQSPQPISTTKHPQPPQRPSVPASLARKVRNLLSATSLPHPPALSAQRRQPPQRAEYATLAATPHLPRPTHLSPDLLEIICVVYIGAQTRGLLLGPFV